MEWSPSSNPLLLGPCCVQCLHNFSSLESVLPKHTQKIAWLWLKLSPSLHNLLQDLSQKDNMISLVSYMEFNEYVHDEWLVS